MCRPETDVARLIATLMVGQHGYGGRHLTDSRHTVVRQADNRFLPTAPPQLIGVVRKRLANALDIAEQPDLATDELRDPYPTQVLWTWSPEAQCAASAWDYSAAAVPAGKESPGQHRD